MNRYFVFVYGTLKRGFPNHYCIQDAKLIGLGTTIDKFPLIVASRFNIPYILAAKNQGKFIQGEIYSVTSDQLDILDDLEGYPEYYNRIPMDVSLSSKVIQCYTYVLDRFKDSLLDLPMLDNYSSEIAQNYIKPKDRPTDVKYSHRDDVLDCTKQSLGRSRIYFH